MDIKTDSTPKTCYKIYSVEVKEDGVYFSCGAIFKDEMVKKRLLGCKKCVVLTATLGHNVSRVIDRLQYESMSQALLYDKSANAYIEEVLDGLQLQIALEANSQGLKTTKRFSPGFKGFSINNQPLMLKLSNATKEAGVTLTNDNLLIPQKSVTALIGLY